MELPTIRIDDEVFKFLKENAEPFVDTPNTVLRRLLRVDEQATESDGVSSRLDRTESWAPSDRPRLRMPKGPRMARGVLLPHDDYVLPILSSIEARGGAAPVADVISAVGEVLKNVLTEADRSLNPSGGIRWMNRTQWVRQKLVDEGLLAKDSPRGIWAITDAGRKRLEELRADS